MFIHISHGTPCRLLPSCCLIPLQFKVQPFHIQNVFSPLYVGTSNTEIEDWAIFCVRGWCGCRQVCRIIVYLCNRRLASMSKQGSHHVIPCIHAIIIICFTSWAFTQMRKLWYANSKSDGAYHLALCTMLQTKRKGWTHLWFFGNAQWALRVKCERHTEQPRGLRRPDIYASTLEVVTGDSNNALYIRKKDNNFDSSTATTEVVFYPVLP